MGCPGDSVADLRRGGSSAARLLGGTCMVRVPSGSLLGTSSDFQGHDQSVAILEEI